MRFPTYLFCYTGCWESYTAKMAAKASLTTSVNNMVEMFNKKVEETLKENNMLTDLLGQAEAKTGLKKANIVAASVAVLAIYLMVGYGSDFLCNFIGFAYPAYKSIKAIETKEKGDDTKWLIYWVVYSIFILLEYFANYLLSWIRFYWFFKCLFLIFCMCPEPFNGSLIIYKNVIRPFFLKHEATIDRGVRHLSNLGTGLADEAFAVAQEALNREASDAIHDAIHEMSEDGVIDDN